MLLTGSQISAAISSFIGTHSARSSSTVHALTITVFIFTSALFLSGYVLQQRTVRNLQTALHPPPPPEPTITSIPDTLPISDRRQHILSTTTSSNLNWKRHAYASVIHRHEDVCSTVMQFAELTRSNSPAQKALLYPVLWDEQIASGEEVGRKLRTTMRLLQKAKKQYKVALYPMKVAKGTTVEEEDGQAESVAYPLASLLTLTLYDRVLSLLPTGLVLDGALLDSLFAADMRSEAAALTGDGVRTPQAVLLRPSMATYQQALKASARGNKMPGMMDEVDVRDGRPWMMSQTSSLSQIPALNEAAFNATEFYDLAAYIRFEDNGVLGPEFDVPGKTMAAARPRHPQARSVWEGIYERFRTERMAVCGLDTEPMPREEPVTEPDA
jgi:hypothetical protein